jgi:hypothetical protein
VGPIHLFKRKDYEYRFQNPGQQHPMLILPGTEPLLLGIWDQDPPAVLVAAQPELRLGDITRFSVLFHERLFRTAQHVGWAEPYKNRHGGLHWSFLPQLLPTFIEFYENQIILSPKDVSIAVAGAGLVDQPDEQAAVRARTAATRLIRDAKFAKLVVTAYNNRCAMCGLNFGLVSGAHIFPVSAPGSTDEITNGISLCDNHHRAFDRHLIWIDPSRRAVRMHPTILKHAESDSYSRNFVKNTFAQLSPPTHSADNPAADNFNERYAFFDVDYRWAK